MTQCSLCQILFNKTPLLELMKINCNSITLHQRAVTYVHTLRQTTIQHTNSVTSFPAFIAQILVMTDRPMGEHFGMPTELCKGVSWYVTQHQNLVFYGLNLRQNYDKLHSCNCQWLRLVTASHVYMWSIPSCWDKTCTCEAYRHVGTKRVHVEHTVMVGQNVYMWSTVMLGQNCNAFSWVLISSNYIDNDCTRNIYTYSMPNIIPTNTMLNCSVAKEIFSQYTAWYWENWTSPELISQGHPQRRAVTSTAGHVRGTLGGLDCCAEGLTTVSHYGANNLAF
jgi:hypothetical protein